MADTDIFAIGSVVCVTPAVGDDVTGEVMAFDQKARILVLKLAASNKKATLNDISTIFTSKVRNISVISEPDANTAPPPVPQIDFPSLRKRFDKTHQERKVINDAVSSKAPLEAQQLFLRIAKCLTGTTWSVNGHIIVMDEVAIVPPYSPSCVRLCATNHQVLDQPKHTRMMDYVKKMVERHYEDKKKNERHHQQQQTRGNSEQSQH